MKTYIVEIDGLPTLVRVVAMADPRLDREAQLRSLRLLQEGLTGPDACDRSAGPFPKKSPDDN